MLNPRLSIVVLIAAFAATGCAGARSQAPSAPTTEPPASPEPSHAAATETPTESSSAAPTTPSATAAPQAGLAAEDLAQVSVDSLNFRQEPSTSAEAVRGRATLARDTVVFVLDGPEEADGFIWYRVAIDGGTGWTAGASADEAEQPYLTEAQVACPEEPVTASDVIRLTDEERLHCFEDRELVFEAWVPESSGRGGTCECTYSPVWLASPFDSITVVLDDEPVDYMFEGDGQWLDVSINPEHVQEPDVHQWVEVTGHFDDPAAQTCERRPAPGSSAESSEQPDRTSLVWYCRTRFVATNFTPVSGP